MQERTDPAPVSTLQLLTDGLANEGVRDTTELTKIMSGMMGEAAGYSVYTFGYGESHNEDMLKAISEVGNGLYFFIENNEVISESFADALGGLLTTFAQNIEIKLQAAMDGYRIVKVRSKKKHQA